MPSDTEKAIDCLQHWWDADLLVNLVVTAKPPMELIGGKLTSVSRERLEFHWVHSIPEESPFVHGSGNITVELTGLSLVASGSSDDCLDGFTIVTITKADQAYCTVRLVNL